MQDCIWDQYDLLQARISEIGQTIATLEAEEGQRLFDYQRYGLFLIRDLRRIRVQEVVDDTKAQLTQEFETSREAAPATYHTSSTSYLGWTSKDKLVYSQQPALNPYETGIPSLCEHIRAIRAPQVLIQYKKHIHQTFPLFVEKVGRIVKPDEHDPGAEAIIQGLQPLLKSCTYELQLQAKKLVRDIVEDAFKDIPGTDGLKDSIKHKIDADWFILSSRALNTVVENRGVISKKTKMKHFANRCNWPADISKLMHPVLKHAHKSYTNKFELLEEALIKTFQQQGSSVFGVIDQTPAKLVTVTRAGGYWKVRFNHLVLPEVRRMVVELGGVMSLIRRPISTAEHNVVNSTSISRIIDALFDNVIRAENMPGSSPNVPHIKMQKAKIEELFLDKDNHIMDQVIKTLISEIILLVGGKIEDHMERIESTFNDCLESIEQNALQPTIFS